MLLKFLIVPLKNIFENNSEKGKSRFIYTQNFHLAFQLGPISIKKRKLPAVLASDGREIPLLATNMQGPIAQLRKTDKILA